jgi:hypothetical protein
VGDRDQLIGDVLADLSTEAWHRVSGLATGEGADRALDTIAQFMLVTSQFEPLRHFARREPGAALRILMTPEGAVAGSLRSGFRQALDSNLPTDLVPVSDDLVDIMVQVATALEWSPIIIGEEAAIDRAVQLMRALIDRTAAAGTAHGP